MRPESVRCHSGSLPQSSSRTARFHPGLDKPRWRALSAGRDRPAHDSPRTHTKMWLERPPIRERYSSGSRFPSITLACTVTARPQPEITKWAVAVLSLNQVVPLPHKCVAFGIRESVYGGDADCPDLPAAFHARASPRSQPSGIERMVQQARIRQGAMLFVRGRLCCQ
jgi:hypothetical protein